MAFLKVHADEYNPKDIQAWTEKKAKLAHINPFANLPYLKYGDKVISESQAVAYAIILLSERRDMLGETGKDEVIHRMIQENINDIREFVLSLVKLSKTDIQMKFSELYRSAISAKVIGLERIIAHKDWFLGYTTLADLEMAHSIELLQWVCDSCQIQSPISQMKYLKRLPTSVRQLNGVRQFERDTKDLYKYFMFPGMARFEQDV